MMNIRVTGISKTFSGIEKKISRLGQVIAQDTLKLVKQFTPIKEGRARRGWRLQRGRKTNRIINNVPYIGLLEKGRTKQAPGGMVRPTIAGIRRRRRKL